MRTVEVAVVGAGPAGCAFALALARQVPGFAEEMLVLERAKHPREKPCGGGITIIGERVLRQLGLTWDRLGVPSVPVHRLRFLYEDRVFAWDIPYIFRVVRRPVFDAALVRHVREAGIPVWEETPVLSLTRSGQWWLLETSRGQVRARVVVGADGAKGVVRKALGLGMERRVSRLVEIFMPPRDPLAREVLRSHTAWFDFTPIRMGVQGYFWDFPTVEEGRPLVNRGVFDSRVWPDRPRSNLRTVLFEGLRERGISEYSHILGHPERWYDPRGLYSRPGAILIGEAAGIDPLLGEGISFALWYGVTVAPWVAEALERGDLSFANYSQRLRSSPLGRHLSLRVALARFAYRRGPEFVRFWWLPLGWVLQMYRRAVLRDMRRESLGRASPFDWCASSIGSG